MNCNEIKPRALPDSLDGMYRMRGWGRAASGTDRVRESPTRGRSLLARSLAAQELLAISDGVATSIRIDRGEVCISEDGAFIDHILCAGQHYTFDRPGRAIVAAQTASRITLYAPTMGFPPRSVEKCDPNRAPSLLYARSPLLNVVAGLIPMWARRPMVAT